MPKVKIPVQEGQPEREEYAIRTMVPNSKLFFFYTVNYEPYTSDSQPMIDLVDNEELVNID